MNQVVRIPGIFKVIRVDEPGEYQGDKTLAITVVCDTYQIDDEGKITKLQGGSNGFVRATFWREMATWVQEYIKVGATVLLDGKLESREYTGKDGARRFSIDLKYAHITHLADPRPRDDAS